MEIKSKKFWSVIVVILDKFNATGSSSTNLVDPEQFSKSVLARALLPY